MLNSLFSCTLFVYICYKNGIFFFQKKIMCINPLFKLSSLLFCEIDTDNFCLKNKYFFLY